MRLVAALARIKLNRAGLDEVPLHEIGIGERVRVGVFGVETIAMTHSIPEPNALLIETAAGLAGLTAARILQDQLSIFVNFDEPESARTESDEPAPAQSF